MRSNTAAASFELDSIRHKIALRFEGQSGCWLWNSTEGFSKHMVCVRSVSGKKVTMGAHRAAFLSFVGDIPVGLMVCHRCAMSGCVNPDHLYLGTASQNMRDRFHGEVLHLSDAEVVFRMTRAMLTPMRIPGTQHVRRSEVEARAALDRAA